MGRRSSFERLPRDYYQTPAAAVAPLVPHLPESRFSFIEPCAGDGRLVAHLLSLTGGRANCAHSRDIEPQSKHVEQGDAMTLDAGCFGGVGGEKLIITNPPWDRKLLHPMITRFATIAPTWLLFDAAWAYTLQAAPFLPMLRKIVTIGRVKWIEDSKMTGKDDSCWYLFGEKSDEAPRFYGRERTSSRPQSTTRRAE